MTRTEVWVGTVLMGLTLGIGLWAMGHRKPLPKPVVIKRIAEMTNRPRPIALDTK